MDPLRIDALVLGGLSLVVGVLTLSLVERVVPRPPLEPVHPVPWERETYIPRASVVTTPDDPSMEEGLGMHDGDEESGCSSDSGDWITLGDIEIISRDAYDEGTEGEGDFDGLGPTFSLGYGTWLQGRTTGNPSGTVPGGFGLPPAASGNTPTPVAAPIDPRVLLPTPSALRIASHPVTEATPAPVQATAVLPRARWQMPRAATTFRIDQADLCALRLGATVGDCTATIARRCDAVGCFSVAAEPSDAPVDAGHAAIDRAGAGD